MKLKKITSCILISLSCTLAQAAELPALLNSIKTMRADFKQTVSSQSGKVMQLSEGKMAIERPGHFRWQVKTPFPQLIIVNQTKMWVYDSDLAQVTIRSIKKIAGNVPALFLSQNNADLKQLFSIQNLPPSAPGWQWFELFSKTKGNIFTKIELGFLQGKLKEMRLHDNLGHITHVVYSQVMLNSALPKEWFHFSIPPGVEVIEEN